MMTKLTILPTRLSRAYLAFLWLLLGPIIASEPVLAETARIKRISLMTPDLDRSVEFFTRVIGFSLDFEGTLPPNGEPFLGPVFNIDAGQPIRRALLSTSSEPRGLFLIEQANSPQPDSSAPRSVVTVIQVQDLGEALARAKTFGAPTSETVSDITPEGVTFSEAMILSPGGHAVLVYEYGKGHTDQSQQATPK